MNDAASRAGGIVDPVGERVYSDDVPAFIEDPATRHYVKLVALTLEQPQEIWYEWTKKPIPGVTTNYVMDQPGVVRRYLSRFRFPDHDVAITVLTTTGRYGWNLREVVFGEAEMEAARCGWLAYRLGPAQ